MRAFLRGWRRVPEAVPDCLIIGAGPAGLAAAIYLARFHLDVLVVDDGESRAGLIQQTRNHAGFPEGISGAELLARMRRQAGGYGVRFEHGQVTALAREEHEFAAETGAARYHARTVLLATGVINKRPRISDEEHGRALARGLLRYCPICDGYEATDQNIAVVGTGDQGTREALFLRGYSARVTLIAPDGAHALDSGQRQKLFEAGVTIIDGPARSIVIEERRITVVTPAASISFDTLYPALGSIIRSTLAIALGASASDDGCLLVDTHQRTTMPGLYAAGDVVLGLDQISHAMGEGGVAATTIRNDLAERTPHYR
jgi:thioredoxin reductase (NADPH)